MTGLGGGKAGRSSSDPGMRWSGTVRSTGVGTAAAAAPMGCVRCSPRLVESKWKRRSKRRSCSSPKSAMVRNVGRWLYHGLGAVGRGAGAALTGTVGPAVVGVGGGLWLADDPGAAEVVVSVSAAAATRFSKAAGPSAPAPASPLSLASLSNLTLSNPSLCILSLSILLPSAFQRLQQSHTHQIPLPNITPTHTLSLKEYEKKPEENM